MPALNTRLPMVQLVLLFASGILASRFLGLSLEWTLILSCAAAVMFLASPLRTFAFSLSVLALGGGLYSFRYAVIQANDLRLLIGDKPALVTVRGRLCETPTIKEFGSATNTVEYSYARIKVTAVLIDKEWRSASGVVATTTPGTLGALYFRGRDVEAVGVMDPPRQAQAPGMFDLREHLYNQRIFYQLRCESSRDWLARSEQSPPLTDRFRRWADHQLGRGLNRDDEALRMIRAMALGDTRSLNGELADAFMRTGTLNGVTFPAMDSIFVSSCLRELSKRSCIREHFPRHSFLLAYGYPAEESTSRWDDRGSEATSPALE